MKEKRKFLSGFFCGAAAVLLAGALIFPKFLRFPGRLQKLHTIEAAIDKSYLGEANPVMLSEGMYFGMVAGLGDPYSRYYTAEQYREENEKLQGAYEGIGVVMQREEDGTIRFVKCYSGSSAEEAGIRVGDCLQKVNREEIRDLQLSEISKKIKKSTKKEVLLTIEREGEQEPLEFSVKIRDIETPAVTYRMLTEDVGCLKIASFTTNSVQQFQSAAEALKEQGMEKLVVDLRENPGGLLDAVCEILDGMLPEGRIVYTEDKYGNRSERRSGGERTLTLPLAVLVNENSASASEIFAGAVQDYGVGTIVGTQTFGKGIVQSTQKLSDKSALKLTISHYYTPNGNDIHGVGIRPDVETALSKEAAQKLSAGEELPLSEDAQLAKALEILQKPS